MKRTRQGKNQSKAGIVFTPRNQKKNSPTKRRIVTTADRLVRGIGSMDRRNMFLNLPPLPPRPSPTPPPPSPHQLSRSTKRLVPAPTAKKNTAPLPPKRLLAFGEERGFGRPADYRTVAQLVIVAAPLPTTPVRPAPTQNQHRKAPPPNGAKAHFHSKVSNSPSEAKQRTSPAKSSVSQTGTRRL